MNEDEGNTLLKVTLVALLDDVGKFAQRADQKKSSDLIGDY